EDVAAQVRILHQLAQVLVHVGTVDGDRLAVAIRRLIAEGIEQALEHGMQAAGADVLLALVHLRGDLGKAFDRIRGEFEPDPFGGQQFHVLAGQRGLRLGEDADEVVLAQRGQLYPDREAALQLRDQVGGLGQVEGTRGNEQDMVGLHRAVLGGHGGSFHQRQQVALHALAGNVAAAHVLATLGDLVDLVDEHDAVLLAGLDRRGTHVVLVDQPRGLLLDQLRARGTAGQGALVGLAAAEAGKHLLELLAHLLHARRGHDVHARPGGDQFQLDLAVVQLAVAQHAAELGAGGILRPRDLYLGGSGTEARDRTAWQQRVEDALLGALLGLQAYARLGLLAVHLDRGIGQVADDLLHVLAHVADLGEAGGLDLDEGRVGQRRQAPRDLGLAHAGGADHQDVLRHHLVAQLRIELHAAPAVGQGGGVCGLGGLLADEVPVQLLHDLARGHGRGIVRGHLGVRDSLFVIRDWKKQHRAGSRREWVEGAYCSYESPITNHESRFFLTALRPRRCGSCRCRYRRRCRSPRWRWCGRPAPYAPAGRARPTARMPAAGSITSPVPLRTSEVSRSATASRASSLPSRRSVRQSLASSTAARVSWPCFSSLASNSSNRVKASAAAPAKPASTWP